MQQVKILQNRSLNLIIRKKYIESYFLILCELKSACAAAILISPMDRSLEKAYELSPLQISSK